MCKADPVATHQKRTSRASGNVTGVWNRWLFAVFFRAEVKGHAFFPKYYLACSTSDPGTADMQDRSAVAVSDRYQGCKKLLAHRRASPDRTETFPGHYSNPKDALDRLFSHFSPEIGSARTPGSFSSERKPTFPGSILTNEAPIESSGIHWFSFVVHWFPRRLIKTPRRRRPLRGPRSTSTCATGLVSKYLGTRSLAGLGATSGQGLICRERASLDPDSFFFIFYFFFLLKSRLQSHFVVVNCGVFWWWDQHTLPTWGLGFAMCLVHQVLPTARGVPGWSPIQVLTPLDGAWLRWSDGNRYVTAAWP